MELENKDLETVTMALKHFMFCSNTSHLETEQKECAELLSDIYDEIGEPD